MIRFTSRRGSADACLATIYARVWWRLGRHRDCEERCSEDSDESCSPASRSSPCFSARPRPWSWLRSRAAHPIIARARIAAAAGRSRRQPRIWAGRCAAAQRSPVRQVTRAGRREHPGKVSRRTDRSTRGGRQAEACRGVGRATRTCRRAGAAHRRPARCSAQGRPAGRASGRLAVRRRSVSRPQARPNCGRTCSRV